MKDINTARTAIIAELERRRTVGDKTVKPCSGHFDPFMEDKIPAFVAGAGTMPCPVCKTGTLRYSRAALNGHIHAACTTKTCVSWME